MIFHGCPLTDFPEQVTVGHGNKFRLEPNDRHDLVTQLPAFDTIKTRLQVAPGQYNGALDCFWKIVRNEVSRTLLSII
jgi:hypothetical protein